MCGYPFNTCRFCCDCLIHLIGGRRIPCACCQNSIQMCETGFQSQEFLQQICQVWIHPFIDRTLTEFFKSLNTPSRNECLTGWSHLHSVIPSLLTARLSVWVHIALFLLSLSTKVSLSTKKSSIQGVVKKRFSVSLGYVQTTVFDVELIDFRVWYPRHS